MEFHPSMIPIAKTFDVKDEKDASDAAESIVKLGFENRKEGFKVLIPKEQRLAKRIGFTVTTAINYGLRQTNQEQNIRYWTYHQDKDHYAIVFISAKALSDLGF
jgi:hypothetical protein